MTRRRTAVPGLALIAVVGIVSACTTTSGGPAATSASRSPQVDPAPSSTAPSSTVSTSAARTSGNRTTATPPTRSRTAAAVSRTATAPADEPWTAPVIVITPTSLGAVRAGMSLRQAETAAGVPFTGYGDGAAYPILRSGPHLYVRLGSSMGFPSCRGAQGDGSGAPSVVTAEGFRLGDPVSTLKSLYGRRLSAFVPAPNVGMAPVAGYTLREPSGTLIFGVGGNAGNRVVEIAGSRDAMQPSGCPG